MKIIRQFLIASINIHNRIFLGSLHFDHSVNPKRGSLLLWRFTALIFLKFF